MIVINEKNARYAHLNVHFSDYEEGSATAKYEALCKDADERAAKSSNPNIDIATERFKNDMGEWLNRNYSRGANHVSWAISGPANYNMRAHEKWLTSERKGWRDYEVINQRFENALRIVPVIKTESAQNKPPRKQEFNSGHFEENYEIERTQIFFNDKPNEEMREKLKSRGWHWSPSNHTWQRQLTENAWNCAVCILGVKAK